MSVDIKLSKKQIKTLIQSGGFLGSLLGKLAGPLMKVAMPLAKNVLAPLGLTTAMSAIDGSIQKKMLGSGSEAKRSRANESERGTNTLITSNDNLNDIMRIIQSLANSGILLKGVTKSVATQTKEQKGGFLSMLLGTLGVSLLGNLLSGKGVTTERPERVKRARGMLRAGEGILTAGKRAKKSKFLKLLPPHHWLYSLGSLRPPHPLIWNLMSYRSID